MFDNLRQDSIRYQPLGGWLAHPGFWIMAVYRFGMWADSMPTRLIRIPLWIIYRLIRLPYALYHVDIWAGRGGCTIGPGFCLIHPTSIMIGRGVVIGKNCKLFHEVTLGTGHVDGTPTLGNNVDVFVGARILGGVSIGADSSIGANCVVTKNIPPNSVVVCSISQVIPKSLSPRARKISAETRPLDPSPP